MFGLPPAEKPKAPKNFKEAVADWFTDSKKRKLLLNVSFFIAGIYITSSFKELTFEAPPLSQPGA